MKRPPIDIVGSCYFTEVRVSAQPNAKPEDYGRIDLEVTTQAFLRKPENPRQWGVLLTVKIKPKEGAFPAYSGDIETFGTFAVDEAWPQDQIERIVYINGSGILYSATREMVCSITARGFWPMLTIPSWSFLEMYKELEETRKRESTKAPAQKPGATPEVPQKA